MPTKFALGNRPQGEHQTRLALENHNACVVQSQRLLVWAITKIAFHKACQDWDHKACNSKACLGQPRLALGNHKACLKRLQIFLLYVDFLGPVAKEVEPRHMFGIGPTTMATANLGLPQSTAVRRQPQSEPFRSLCFRFFQRLSAVGEAKSFTFWESV